MAKSSAVLDWCIVRLGADHNWWVDEVSDPVRWDVDGLGIIDPRQMAHLIESAEPLRDYGLVQETLDIAFIPFRIEREEPKKRIRLKRVKDSFYESEDKLFGLPDILDEENGPYADLLDHLTRCRVKMLNDVFAFESKLTVDELEDDLRESQNALFAEGKSLHPFDELCAILDFMPAGYDEDGDESHRKGKAKAEDDIDDADLPELDEAEEEQLKGDETLSWDKEEETDEEEKPAPTKAAAGSNAEPEEDWSKDEDEEEEEADSDDDDDSDDDKPIAKKSSASKKSSAKKSPPPRRKR